MKKIIKIKVNVEITTEDGKTKTEKLEFDSLASFTETFEKTFLGGKPKLLSTIEFDSET